MGREAIARVRYGDRIGETRVLLESEGLILRAPVAARIPRADVRNLAVEGDDLTGTGPEGIFRLTLGAAQADRWKTALETPPPTLAKKLELRPDVAIWTSGDFDTPELAEALSGTRRMSPADAAVRLIRADSLGALMRGLDDSAGSSAPVWVIHGKGRGAAFGDNAAREAMRDGGYVDVKASAVSATLSATRYVKR